MPLQTHSDYSITITCSNEYFAYSLALIENIFTVLSASLPDIYLCGYRLTSEKQKLLKNLYPEIIYIDLLNNPEISDITHFIESGKSYYAHPSGSSHFYALYLAKHYKYSIFLGLDTIILKDFLLNLNNIINDNQIAGNVYSSSIKNIDHYYKSLLSASTAIGINEPEADQIQFYCSDTAIISQSIYNKI